MQAEGVPRPREMPEQREDSVAAMTVEEDVVVEAGRAGEDVGEGDREYQELSQLHLQALEAHPWGCYLRKQQDIQVNTDRRFG